MFRSRRDPLEGLQSLPAPWNLKGRGLIVLLKGNLMATLADPAIPMACKGTLKSPLRLMMLVDYAESDAGPYQELLMIPGSVKMGGKRDFTISNIVVSTMLSVVNGRANWGIPKKLANFNWTTSETGENQVMVSNEEVPLFKIAWQGVGFHFPVTTKLVPPALRTLGQIWDKHVFTYRPTASGKARYARISEVSTLSDEFPIVNSHEVLAAFEIPEFNMSFPVPEIKTL